RVPLLTPSPLFFFAVLPRPRRSTLFPYTTLFRSLPDAVRVVPRAGGRLRGEALVVVVVAVQHEVGTEVVQRLPDRLRRGRSGRRSEEHTSELQSRGHLVCRLLLEKKNKASPQTHH